jgi:hypothetical protein
MNLIQKEAALFKKPHTAKQSDAKVSDLVQVFGDDES